MSVINTNASALIAQNALVSNARSSSTAMQQLSTGLRINGAKDDAAGLAIAAKMTSQIRGLDQAVRNGNDAISMMQTADGALSTVGDMLQRMRELAVQAASDTNVAADRTALNSEFTALKTEIGRVGATTQWNGMGLLNGSTGSGGVAGQFSFQLGANNNTAALVTANMLNIASTTGTVTDSPLTTVTTTAGADQVSTTKDAHTTFAVGQKVNATVNGKDYSYTVTGNDIATGATSATSIANVLNNAAAAYTAAGLTSAGTGVVVTVGAAGKLVFTANPAAKSFSVSTSTSSGGDYVTGNVNTQADALAALNVVDTKLSDVNAGRSNLGATINRLTYAVDNLANVSQNASASRSRVQDTDYAKASTELARTQIIAQAATAMLAQANQSQQSVLALLK
jgi:flagellin